MKPEFIAYNDPLIPSGQILMGYKGNSYMDSGYFWAPYVPMTQTPAVLDPNSFAPIDQQILDGIDSEDSFYKPKLSTKKVHRSITDSWEVSRFD